MARIAFVQDFALWEANQRHEPTQKTMRFAQTTQLLDDSAAHQTKIASVARDRHLAHLIDQAVANLRNDALGQHLAFTRGAAGGNDIVALLRLAKERLNQFWRVLEIHVDDRAPLTAAIENAGHRAGRLPEPAAEHKKPDVQVARDLLLDRLLRPIRRRIETKQDLIRAETLEHRHRSLEERSNVVLFVVDRYDHRDQRRLTAAARPGATERG